MTSVTIRMDEKLKSEAETLFDDWGMNMTTAITCFVKKCVATGVMPFTIGEPMRDKHAELLAALREAQEVANDPNAPRCTDPAKLEKFLFP